MFPKWIRSGRPALLTTIAVCCLTARAEEQPSTGMLTLSLEGRKLEGQPLSWNEDEVHLLGRDGRLWRVEIGRIQNWQHSKATFQAYEPSWFRAALLEELGKNYAVSGTSHYLVAHPQGQGEHWAQQLEDFYRSFVHFFAVRGFTPSRPPFPLVAVVCRNRADFQRYTARSASGLSGSSPLAGAEEVLGYYDRWSNRLVIFDMQGKAESTLWRENRAVLVHEATHQAAFNTGIHTRYCPPPLWLAEGLAMVFESSGVYAPHRDATAGSRVNAGRLQTFRRLPEKHLRWETLASLVAEDVLFERDPQAAYALSWAMSFYLLEQEPAKYFGYLRRTAARTAFQPYTKAERTGDFRAFFGDNWPLLHAHLLRFINSLP